MTLTLRSLSQLACADSPLNAPTRGRKQPRKQGAKQPYGGKAWIGKKAEVEESVPQPILPSTSPSHLIQQHLLECVHLGGARDEPVQNSVPASNHWALRANPRKSQAVLGAISFPLASSPNSWAACLAEMSEAPQPPALKQNLPRSHSPERPLSGSELPGAPVGPGAPPAAERSHPPGPSRILQGKNGCGEGLVKTPPGTSVQVVGGLFLGQSANPMLLMDSLCPKEGGS